MTKSSEKDEIKDLKQIQLMLKSNLSEDRFQAIHILLKNDYHDAEKILQKVVFENSQVSVRELALISLIELNPQKSMKLLKTIINNVSENKDIRARAVWALSKIKTEEAFELLKISLIDKTEEVLYWAIFGSIYFDKNQEIIPLIREHLTKSRQSLIRQTAAWVLGMIRDYDSRELLEKQLLYDAHPSVRLLCASALIRLDDMASIPVLCKALQKDANEMTRREIANALGSILDIQKTTDQNTDNISLKDLKASAIRGLSKTLLRDQSYIVRRSCAESLGKIKDKSAVKNLINAITIDNNHFVRSEIARTLGKIGDARAIEVLINATRSQYRKIVDAAKIALEQIGKSNE